MHPKEFRNLIESEQFLDAARFAVNMPETQMTTTGTVALVALYRTMMVNYVVETAFTAGAFDQLRAIKDDPACAKLLSEKARLRIQDETPTLVMRVPVPSTDFDDDAKTNSRGTGVAG